MIQHLVAALVIVMAAALPARAEITVQEVTSPLGNKAWLVQDGSIPFVAISLRFSGGQSLDPVDKRGVVNLMTALIEEGTGDLDSQGFAAARDTLAASMSFDSDADGVTVKFQTLTEHRDAAVALLARALSEPRFDQPSIDRVKGQVFAILREKSEDPGDIIWETASADLFGAHPYGTSGDGTMESVSALTRDDIVAAHRSSLVRDRLTVGASGDISADELARVMDELIGNLPQSSLPLPQAIAPAFTGKIKLLDFPGPQSTVLFGHAGVSGNDPDFLTVSLLNEIIGGRRFSARLMSELREKRGLTYGVRTSLQNYDQAALLMGSLQTSNDNVAEVIRLIRAEWARIATEPVPEEELARVKAYMAGSYPLRWDGNDSIAGILVGMQELGLPIDYSKQRNARVMAITPDDLSRVAKRVFQPESLSFFVAGQPTGPLEP